MNSLASKNARDTVRRVVSLLAVAVFINYFDRGTVATASPLLQKELGLSDAELGILFSAFFWTYAPLQPFAGWLAQRFDVRYVHAHRFGVELRGAAGTESPPRHR